MNYEQLKPNTDNQEYTLNMSIESTQSIFSLCYNYTELLYLHKELQRNGNLRQRSSKCEIKLKHVDHSNIPSSLIPFKLTV